MPFLFPALVSGLSDALILGLQEHRGECHLLIAKGAEGSADPPNLSVHSVQYLSFAAVFRLLLVLFPLPYHSYTGTAIRFPLCYSVFYLVSLSVVLIHMIALSMIDPDSIAALVPSGSASTTDSIGSVDASNMDSPSALQYQLRRSCWWILFLSCLSSLSHIMMLVHVRSTAPSIEHIPYHSLGNRKKKLVYYYVSRHLNFHDKADFEGNLSGTSAPSTPPPITPTKRKRESKNETAAGDIEQQKEEQLEIGVDLLISLGETDVPKSPMQKLTNQYDDFLSEMQARISLLKQDWNHKLDDFTHLHLNTAQGSNTAATNRIVGNHQRNNPLLPLTPFRVLLQLFAYEDVIDSGKLDAVFDMDHGESITFFVPQLVSFLLHGAYYEADPTKLEAWILDKCSTHIHFAHRCYWFLKAWSLEQSYQPVQPYQPSVAPRQATSSTSFANSLKGCNGNNNSIIDCKGRLAGMSTSSSHISPVFSSSRTPTNQTSHSRTNSWSSLTGGNQNGNTSNLIGTSQKLLPEERVVIEDLMLRVVQSGEASARRLQSGLHSIDEGKSTSTGIRRGNQELTGKEPPRASLHGDSEVKAGRIKSPDGLYLDQDATSKKEQELTLSTATTITISSTESFQATPGFLDALLAIADGLFLSPRDERKKQLILQLKALEVELLPSNAVYVPIGDVHHRVRRIVAEESIALHTKERVPCIILLEVVGYNKHRSENAVHEKESSFPDDGCGSRTSRGKRSLELPKLELPKLVLKRATRSKLACEKALSSHKSLGFSASSSLQATSSASSPFALPSYTLMGGMRERDVVNHWKYERRDPHRIESIVDKMTSSLPLDMNGVKERIHQLRDKQGAIFNDFLALSNSDDIGTNSVEGLARGGGRCGGGGESKGERKDFSPMESNRVCESDCEIAAFIDHDPSQDNTTKTDRDPSIEDQYNTHRDESPERETLDVSMGQWTSPTAERSKISPHQVDNSKATRSRWPLRLPVQNIDGNHQGNRDCDPSRLSTVYGSTCDGPGQSSNEVDGRPPRSCQPTETLHSLNTKKPPKQVVFRENWQAKEERLRPKSAYGSHSGWHLLPILVKANDDLRQEQLASQLIQKMAVILARERVPVWLCPYEIIAISDRGGIVEAIPDTISLDSLKRNNPNFVDLKTFFYYYFGEDVDNLADAKSNFVESLAAYSIVTFLLQVKDRHNGNILLDNQGHLIHIDFGFFFLSSPGKNTGFESAPFKLTRDFVEVLGGPESHSFRTFRELCVRSFLVLRRHCMEIILLVEMLKSGNEDLSCFLGRPDDAIRGLRERFRLDLSDRACREYVHSLIDESLENWRTNWYDRYQRYCVGVL